MRRLIASVKHTRYDMINIKPVTNRVLKTNALDFEGDTFVGLKPGGKWYCVPMLYRNNLYLLNKVRFDMDDDDLPIYETYNLISDSRKYCIEGRPDIEHQPPELQLLCDLYYGNEVRLLTDDLPIVCQNGSWFAEDDLAGLIPFNPVFFYYEGWYMAHSYSDFDNCKVWRCTLDYRPIRNTLATLECIL